MLGARRLAWITAAASVTVVIGATASWIHGRSPATQAGAAIPSPTWSAADTSLTRAQSVRIPVAHLASIGTTVTLVSPASVPSGSIVSQTAAEQTAAAYRGERNTVLGTALGSVIGFGSRPPASHLYWIVSIDPPGGAYASDGTALNYDDLFIDAASGSIVGNHQSLDPSLPPLPHNAANPRPPAIGHGGLDNTVSPTPYVSPPAPSPINGLYPAPVATGRPYPPVAP